MVPEALHVTVIEELIDGTGNASATMLTFLGSAVKIIENHLGVAFVRISQQVAFQVRGPGSPQVMFPDAIQFGEPFQPPVVTP